MNCRLLPRQSLPAVAIAFCLTCMALTSCSVAASLPKDAREISVVALQKQPIESVLFIDVRTPAEYASDRIGDSPLVPISEIEAGAGVEQIKSAIAQRSVDAGQPVTVILYCERGFRSARAQKVLETEGIQSISLAGGIRAWRQQTPRDRDAEALQELNHV